MERELLVVPKPPEPPEAPDDLRIYVPEAVWEKMHRYVKLCPTEISWLGLVEREGNEFTIEDVFLVPQEVTGATTNMDSNAMFDLANDFVANGRENDLDKIRFWGHSHVNMGVSPSQTDKNTVLMYNEPGIDYWIAAILVKSGHFRFDAIFYSENVRYIDVPVYIPDSRFAELDAQVEAEIKANVRKPAPKPVTPVKNGASAVPATSLPSLSKKDRKHFKKYVMATDKTWAELPSGIQVYKDKTTGNWKNSKTQEIVVSSYAIDQLKYDAGRGWSEQEIDNLVAQELERGNIQTT